MKTNGTPRPSVPNGLARALLALTAITKARMRTLLAGLCVLTLSMAAVVVGASPAQAEITELPICAPLVGQTCNGNVALNAVVVSSHLPCTLGSGPENAVDGASSNIYTDKWCVRSGQPTLTINLPYYSYGFSLSKIVVKHAGVAGESPALNTRAYRLLTRTSTAFCAWSTAATVTNNTANQTVHGVSGNNVAQVQLAVDVPTQGTNQATRIYEVEVWGTPSTTRPPPCGFGL
jgi:hypothetical protein